MDRSFGSEFTEDLGTWIATLRECVEFHPLTRSCIAYSLWRSLGLSRRSEVLEPAVIASKIAVSFEMAMPFVPIANRNRRAFQSLSSDPKERLHAWVANVEKACRSARRELLNLKEWEEGALRAISTLSGNTPPILTDLLLAHPVVSARMLMNLGNVSSASAQRAPSSFENLGLTIEITGGGRFRFWRAAIPRV